MRCRFWAVGLALGLAACATDYGDMGFTGGVRADQMSADTYRIVARGNAYTDSTRIADFAVRRAAEATLESGHEWFMVLGRDDQTSVGQLVTTTPRQTYGTATTTAFGSGGYGTATTTFNATTYGGQTQVTTIYRPGEDLLIRVGKGPRPDGAWDAAETLRYVLPRTESANDAGSVARRALLGF